MASKTKTLSEIFVGFPRPGLDSNSHSAERKRCNLYQLPYWHKIISSPSPSFSAAEILRRRFNRLEEISFNSWKLFIMRFQMSGKHFSALFVAFKHSNSVLCQQCWLNRLASDLFPWHENFVFVEIKNIIFYSLPFLLRCHNRNESFHPHWCFRKVSWKDPSKMKDLELNEHRVFASIMQRAFTKSSTMENSASERNFSSTIGLAEHSPAIEAVTPL